MARLRKMYCIYDEYSNSYWDKLYETYEEAISVVESSWSVYIKSGLRVGETYVEVEEEISD